jgi:hypothetical protein
MGNSPNAWEIVGFKGHFGKRIPKEKQDLPSGGGTATAARPLFPRYCPAQQDMSRCPQ